MNIDRLDSQIENIIDKMERGSRWLSLLCCGIVLYFVIRGMVG